MNINERIRKIGKYFRLFNMTDEGSYVLVQFDSKWVVPTDCSDIVTIRAEKGSKYYFIADASVDLDVIFDVIDEVILLNKEAMEKNNLFLEKISELKEIFETTELSTLKKLTFVFEDDGQHEDVMFFPTKRRDKRNKAHKNEETVETEVAEEVSEVVAEGETASNEVETEAKPIINSDTVNGILSMANEIKLEEGR